MSDLALIGFGEAGRNFASDGDWAAQCRVFDVRSDAEMVAAIHAAGAIRCDNANAAVRGADVVLSLVTADQSRKAAEIASQAISPGTLFFDMNSVAPDTKRGSAEIIEAAGGRYVDVAIMAPVDPGSLHVPLLVCGPNAVQAMEILGQIGFTNVRNVGPEIGRASTIKMLRSVMYKGVEALTAECLIACERAGVTQEVMDSFGNDWSNQANYRLDRMMVHGVRRGAEMSEAVATLRGLGVEPMLTSGTVRRQHELGELAVAPVPHALKSKLKTILGKLP